MKLNFAFSIFFYCFPSAVLQNEYVLIFALAEWRTASNLLRVSNSETKRPPPPALVQPVNMLLHYVLWSKLGEYQEGTLEEKNCTPERC